MKKFAGVMVAVCAVHSAVTGIIPTACAADSSEIISAVKARHLHDVKGHALEVAKLSPSERKVLLDQLIQALQSANWEEQANAAYIAGLLGPEAAPAVPYLIKAMDARMENVAGSCTSIRTYWCTGGTESGVGTAEATALDARVAPFAHGIGGGRSPCR